MNDSQCRYDQFILVFVSLPRTNTADALRCIKAPLRCRDAWTVCARKWTKVRTSVRPILGTIALPVIWQRAIQQKVHPTHYNLWRRRMLRPSKEGHQRPRCRMSEKEPPTLMRSVHARRGKFCTACWSVVMRAKRRGASFLWYFVRPR